MRIKEGFMLRNIAGQWVVVPLGTRVVEFNGIMTLNESGAVLWRKLEQEADEDDLVREILAEYDVDEATAKADVREFIRDVRDRKIIQT